jgi:hypothetical protein
MVTVEGWPPQSAGAAWDRAGWPGSHGSVISEKPDAATDALTAALTDALGEAVLAAVALAGVAAGPLALLPDEELQPAARAMSAASTAARAATAPMAVSILVTVFLPLAPGFAVFG